MRIRESLSCGQVNGVVMLAVFKGYRVFSTITALGIIATAGAGCAFAQAKSSATMAMSWAFEGSHIGYLMAMEKGLYKEEGVDVQVNRGFGAADTIRRMITCDID